MSFKKGDTIKIKGLLEKDYDYLDGQFEELSRLANGQEGVVLSYNEASPEFGERESYQVLVNCTDGMERELEIEPDEIE